MTLPPLTNSQVQNLQKVLKAAGIYNGPINGRMGGATTRALRSYQAKNGLPVTGIYDTATDRFLIDSFKQLGLQDTKVKGLDDKTKKFIQENYGYLMVYLKHPEIGPIIVQAAKEGWDEARLQGKLKQTKWYRTIPATARAWQRDIYEDPASVARRRAAQEAIIRDQANSFGLFIRPKRLAAIVEHSLMFGWSQEQITDALVAESRYNGGDLPIGSIATDTRSIEDLRRRYLLPDSEKQSYKFARRIARGELTMDDLEALFAKRAANTYGHLSDQLDSGLSMMDLFDGHISAIADELELDPDSIDLTDPRWSDVLSFVDDKGNTRSMTIGEARRLARSQPGFRRTDKAREQGASLAATIGQAFGKFAA